MPVMRCTEKGKPGYRWGNGGKCYTYTPNNTASESAAKLKAAKQGFIISKSSGEKFKP